MSIGKLCNQKFKISLEVNSKNTIEVDCDLYEGHDGNHERMLYHCIDRQEGVYSWIIIAWEKLLGNQIMKRPKIVINQNMTFVDVDIIVCFTIQLAIATIIQRALAENVIVDIL